MKVKAGKVAPAVPGNALLSAYYAAKKLEKLRNKDPKWLLAAACASDRFLLIGKPQR